MVEGSSEMNVIKRKTIDTEESFEKIGEEVEKKETQVSKKLDKVTQDNKIDEKQQEMAEMKTEKEKRGFLTFLLAFKEIVIRFVLFGIVYLFLNRVYKLVFYWFE